MENVLLILFGSLKRKKFSTYYITLRCLIPGKFVIYGTVRYLNNNNSMQTNHTINTIHTIFNLVYKGQ
uniref:Uncharacterized protein n=1 Tax=uncultured marine virus TaxID=186617 RepID=A0A0F7L9J7_9VIRU|nr:hypothetical protein [uncultured marine virus]